jgi:hypothetical protein
MFRRTRKASDFGAEIEAHIELETERLQEQGLSYEDARTAARRAFGNVTRAQERFYKSGRSLGWDHFWQDVRYGLRMLRKSPGFTAIAVLTIAVGIGATTAIFSVVDATLLHPLPYPQPEQLVSIEHNLPGVGAQDVGMSEPEWQDLQRSGIFEYVSPAWFDENNLTGSSQPARVRLLIVAPNYFALLGVKPQLGRSFNPADHSPGLLVEVLISDGLWKRSSGATRMFWVRVCDSTPTCIRSSASCQPVLTPPGERRTKGISTPGPRRVFTARLWLIARRGTGEILRQQSPDSNLD